MMKFLYLSTLILAFEICFANASKNQRQYVPNGKEIDPTSSTSLENRMKIFGPDFEDLHRNIDRSTCHQDSSNYQVKLVKYISVLKLRHKND